MTWIKKLIKKSICIFAIFFIVFFSKCNSKKENINELKYTYSPLQPLGYYNFDFNKNNYPNWDCLREMRESKTWLISDTIHLRAPSFIFRLPPDTIKSIISDSTFCTFSSDSTLINNDTLINKE
jgi:hypothetical protein